MADRARLFDVAAFLDGRTLSAFNYRIIVLSWLITVFDGLDLMMISFTAPYIKDAFALTRPMLGNLFAAGTAGQILGGFLFCYIADRIGRRPTVIGTSFLFGLLTIATAFAHNITNCSCCASSTGWRSAGCCRSPGRSTSSSCRAGCARRS